MKLLSKTVLAVYLLILVWLVVFKFSLDPSLLAAHQARNLSLVPFANISPGNLRETVYNVIVFIPFGALLSVNLKRTGLWRQLAFVFAFSLAAETIQWLFAIGIADTTDLITNTLGGFLGLVLYALGARYVDTEKLDRSITVGSTAMLAVFTLLLATLLSHGLRYRSAPPGERPERSRVR